MSLIRVPKANLLYSAITSVDFLKKIASLCIPYLFMILSGLYDIQGFFSLE